MNLEYYDEDFTLKTLETAQHKKLDVARQWSQDELVKLIDERIRLALDQTHQS